MEGNMKITRAFALACAFTVIPLTAAACGDSYDRGEFVQELVDTGSVTEAQAECVADRVEDEIGVDRLNSRTDELSEEDQEILTSAVFDCLLGTE